MRGDRRAVKRPGPRNRSTADLNGALHVVGQLVQRQIVFQRPHVFLDACLKTFSVDLSFEFFKVDRLGNQRLEGVSLALQFGINPASIANALKHALRPQYENRDRRDQKKLETAYPKEHHRAAFAANAGSKPT